MIRLGFHTMADRWLIALAALMMLGFFAAIAVGSKAKSDCKVAAIQAQASAEIIELCNKEG